MYLKLLAITVIALQLDGQALTLSIRGVPVRLGMPVVEILQLFEAQGAKTLKDHNRVDVVVPWSGGGSRVVGWLNLYKENGKEVVWGACKDWDIPTSRDADLARAIITAIDILSKDAPPTLVNNARIETSTRKGESFSTETLAIRMGQRNVLLTRVTDLLGENVMRLEPTLQECMGAAP